MVLKTKKIGACLLVLALLVGASLVMGSTRVGTVMAEEGSWVLNPANGHLYRLTDPMPWMDAEAQAVEWGGHLVTLNSWEEELWIKERFGRYEHFWIGFSDIDEEGAWVWSSGAPVTYTNWDTGEPNDYQGEDAAVMNWKHCVDGDCYGDYWNDLGANGDLRGVVEKSLSEVAIDIKPGSCPNSLNMGRKGVLPVAIMGTDELDVTQIDPASITLEGVSPLRWSLEDAGFPYEPYTGKGMAYDCIEYHADEYGVFDGIYDLSLKFKAQEVVVALGEVHDGDVLVLQLTGKLKEEYGGTAFVGEDVVVIIENIGPTRCRTIFVIDTFDSPEGSQPHGLAFDGDHLWYVGRDTRKIYQLTLDGVILSSFATPGQGPTGLAFDGTYLWHANDNPPTIYKLDTSGNVIRFFTAPGSDSTGLTFEGEYLWNADFDWDNPGGYLHRIDVSNPDDITYTSFASPGEGPEGLTFDGTYLWHVDYSDNKIYQLDTSANVICSYQSFGIHPIGLTFDGTYLWLADETTRVIYRIDIGRR